LPAAFFGGVEVYVDGGADGVVGVEHGLDGTFADEGAGDARGNAFADHVGQFLVHQQGRVGTAVTDKAVVEPLPGDTFQLAEQVEFWLFAGVAPPGVE